MAYTTIDDPSAYFQIALYNGTGGLNLPKVVTNDGVSNLKPDFLWIKDRGAGYSHALFDSNRGRAKVIYSDSTVAEASSGTNDDLVSFDTDGFSVGAPSNANSTNGGTTAKVGWQWVANGGTTSSNNDGDLTSTVQFNSTSKFSIITYTAKNPIEPLDIGHGMGEVPDVVIVKNRDRSVAWGVYHKDLTSPAENRYLSLNSTAQESANSTVWRNEAPTSSIIKTGESAILNQPNEKIVMYAWKSVKGFSQFGTYTGNGKSTAEDGPFVYTGFRPAWVLIKPVDATNMWIMFDSKRKPFNSELVYSIYANSGTAEYAGTSYHNCNLYSNGFQPYLTDSSLNGTGTRYVFLAFAEHPFVTSDDAGSIPVTAR